MKNKSYIYQFCIFDGTDSIYIKCFSKNQHPYLSSLKKGRNIAVYGIAKKDNYLKEVVIIANGICDYESENNLFYDNAEHKRIELHLHTKMSVMDGVSSVEEYFNLANKYGHQALAFTDHLNVQAFPEIYRLSKQYPQIKPIYGVEMEMFDDVIDYCKNPADQDLKTAKYVFFDLETTGLSAKKDEIIEFGAIVYNGVYDNSPTNHEYLIKPTIPLPKISQEISGLTDADLVDAKSIQEIFPIIKELIGDAILVAHNANFDVDFLNSVAAQLGYPPFTNTVIDTLAIARALVPKSKNYQLGTIANKLNVTYNVTQAHRALYDVEVLVGVYQHLFRVMQNEYKITKTTDIYKIHNPLIYGKIRPQHVTVLVKNQAGLKDLFKLISASYTEFFYRSPRIPRQLLNEHRANLLIGSGCVNGEIFNIATTKTDEQLAAVMKFYDYIEIQPPEVYSHLITNNRMSQERLEQTLTTITALAHENNHLIVASGDVHYDKPSKHIIRDIYIGTKSLRGVSHPLYNFRTKIVEGPHQHYRNTFDMVNAFKFLNNKQWVANLVQINPHKINDMIADNIKIIKHGLYTPKIVDAAEKLTLLCHTNAKKQYGEVLPSIVKERLDLELSKIIDNNYAVIY